MNSHSVKQEDSKNIAKESSYGQILRSSSIIGGSQALSYVIGMVKTKAVAVLLGPAGVGLVGLYVSVTGFVSTFTGLGLVQSGVREIAESEGGKNRKSSDETAASLMWACLITGIFGWLVMVLLSRPMSVLIFGNDDQVVPLSILGSTVLLSAISGGQTAVLQGKRRIGALAKVGVVSVLAGTVCAVLFYGWVGEKGIVPVLIATALLNLAASWYYSRNVRGGSSSLSWRQKYDRAKGFLALGIAFMWSALLAATVALVTRSIIVNQLGLEAGGVYQAAWGLSGMFAGFILSAMGTDFYPRLTAVADDHEQVNRLVNEQSDIGILLALPGLIGTLAFAPWIMHVFFSREFVAGATLLPWFIVGIFGRVVSFPVGYILLAKGCSRWFASTETISNVLLLLLTIGLLREFGLVGTSYAFAIFYGLHTIGMVLLARHLTGFRWTRETVRLLLLALMIVIAGVSLQAITETYVLITVGAFLTLLTSLFSLRGILLRLGGEHRWVVRLREYPLIRILAKP